MTDRIFNVLFLCTGNSARSIIAEAILQQRGTGRFNAFSAGSQPAGRVHPDALELLEGLGHDTGKFCSKSWDEFTGADAPEMDFVFTVCGNAADEVCPVWPGGPITSHWGLPDPAAVTESKAERREAFAETYRALSDRISSFVKLPVGRMDEALLQNELNRIGHSGKATA